MANFDHLGSNVCAVIYLPTIYSRHTKESRRIFREFSKQLKESKYRYFIAITANRYQEPIRPVLARHGFKPYIDFYSQHGTHENLTLWLKIRQRGYDNANELIGITNGRWNCSVNLDGTTSKKCNIAIKSDPNQKLEENFKQFGKTPIHVWIKDDALIKKYEE